MKNQNKKYISPSKGILTKASSNVGIKSTHTEELVIGLCGPVGSPLHKVAELLKELLEKEFDYECEVIKLSSFIEGKKGAAADSSRFSRVSDLIAKGNGLREDFGNSVLADLAIDQISSKREYIKDNGSEKTLRYKPKRICHIIDSIKNQQELEAFRAVYRDMFYFVGVYSSLQERQRNMEKSGMAYGDIYQLIDRDSGQEKESGQTVGETFPNSDFFLRVENDLIPPLKKKIKRFLDIIFGINVLTPTVEETAMYMASSAAGNSACLSRQVGAALTDKNGEIISLGWNDVPKFGGNLYQENLSDPEAQSDHRCMNKEKCFNDLEKYKISKEIVEDLIKKDLLQKDALDTAINIVRKSKIRGLIEFSRSVHAEMHAIIIGSQIAGERVKGGKLYCTTYPCHSCARHIIVSGIREVYYIEPYRKSLAIDLHGEDITETESEKDKVRILLFEGISPTRYYKFFKIKSDSRKNKSGEIIKLDRKTAFPIFEVSLESLPALEAIIVHKLVDEGCIEDPYNEQGISGGDGNVQGT